MTAPAARRAFTLIEMLVVLTIIGILTALLLPVLLNARERARQTQCVSNLHQIGLAIQMYQEDHGGRLPAKFADVDHVTAGEQGNLDQLLPYEHSSAIYHCPDADDHVDGSFGPFGAAYLDYNSRISELLDSGPTPYHRGAPSGLLKPEPMSVLVYDAQHVNNQQLYLVLRENGSVSRVASARTRLWCYVAGRWEPWPDPPFTFPQPQPASWDVFPDEPWPPQFEQQH